jgi:hypothetical protein
MKPRIADPAFVLSGSQAGRGVVLVPMYALRTNSPKRQRQQRESVPLAACSEVGRRWPTGVEDDAHEAVNRWLEGDLRWPAL